jgi:hypothetical protein
MTGAPDRLEEMRSELADVELAISESGDAVPRDLADHAEALRRDVLAMEREARVEAGVQPVEVLDADPAAFRNPAADLVVPPMPPTSTELAQATMVVLDKHDEDQVLAIIEERMDPVLLYDFNRSGTKVVGLSVKGVFEAVRLLNATGHARIKAMPETASFGSEHRDVGYGTEEFVVCTIAAADEVSGLVVLGTAMEPVNMRKRNGETPFDVFCRAKALSKAQRNALAGHIPERLKQAMIAMHQRKEGRVLEIKHGAGASAAAQLPPPVDTPEMRALEDECRRLWVEVRKFPRWREKMMPGVFNSKLSHARSSVAEMESFRDALVSLRDGLAKAAS